MFEEYSAILKHNIPNLEIAGENYPPKPIFFYLSYVVLVIRLTLVLLVIAGPEAFQKVGLQPPEVFLRAYDNKVN